MAGQEEIKDSIARESDILLQVRHVLRYSGWEVVRFHLPFLQVKGYPDIIAMKNGETVFIEVKRSNGKLTKQQKQFKKKVIQNKVKYVIARSVEDVMPLCGDLIKVL